MMVKIRKISAAETLPVRLPVLRPGLPEGQAGFEGDHAPEAGHFGAFDGPELIGVATVLIESPRGERAFGKHTPEPHWRIRGVAVLDSYRGRGIGGRLTEACLDHATSAGGGTVWCYARPRAAAVYERLGFSRHGEEFDIPGVGPHLMMVLGR